MIDYAKLAGWSHGNNTIGIRIAGTNTQYRINWGDGQIVRVDRNEDTDGDGVDDAAFGWHDYASDGTYDVAVYEPRAGVPPIRMKAFMYARDDDNLVFRTTRFADMVATGDGNDDIRTGEGEDLVAAAGGNDLIDGGAGDDVLDGGVGNDLIRGGTGSDLVVGDGGDDMLYGGDDRDFVYGGAGRDFLYGDAGDDYLSGGAGVDRLTGGAGFDVFVLGPSAFDADGSPLDDPDRDIVADFNDGDDRLDVSGWGETFQFVGRSAFVGQGYASLRAVTNGSVTIVYGDVDGDQAADFSFALLGGYTLTQSDFNGVALDM